MKIKFIQKIIDKIRGKKHFKHIKIDWKNKELYVQNIKNSFKNCYGYDLDLENPKTLSEKMMWLRVYDNTPLKTKCADKYEVREYVKEKIGEEYLIPLLGVYDDFDEIDFDKLPNQFVMKCNHGCGYNIIVKDKNNFNKEEAKEKINTWLKEDFGAKFGEIHYSSIKPRIIIEEYIENIDGDIEDFKYFAFDGKVHSIMYCTDRASGVVKNSFFDLNWKNLYFHYFGELLTKEVEKPKNFELMNEIAEKLSKDFKHVRVDLYNIEGKIYFGELTFTGYGGYYNFQPIEWNRKLGDLLDLNISAQSSRERERERVIVLAIRQSEIYKKVA